MKSFKHYLTNFEDHGHFYIHRNIMMAKNIRHYGYKIGKTHILFPEDILYLFIEPIKFCTEMKDFQYEMCLYYKIYTYLRICGYNLIRNYSNGKQCASEISFTQEIKKLKNSLGLIDLGCVFSDVYMENTYKLPGCGNLIFISYFIYKKHKDFTRRKDLPVGEMFFRNKYDNVSEWFLRDSDCIVAVICDDNYSFLKMEPILKLKPRKNYNIKYCGYK